MIGKTISPILPLGINSSRFFFDEIKELQTDHKIVMRFIILSNGVNKILEKLGEARLLGTCIGEINEVTNG